MFGVSVVSHRLTSGTGIESCQRRCARLAASTTAVTESLLSRRNVLRLEWRPSAAIDGEGPVGVTPSRPMKPQRRHHPLGV